ncbi:hypothetical protein P8452_44920 [Trifolium repens]|nr:hypothetical protein P8452_44920 [Trifolium repens]
MYISSDLVVANEAALYGIESAYPSRTFHHQSSQRQHSSLAHQQMEAPIIPFTLEVGECFPEPFKYLRQGRVVDMKSSNSPHGNYHSLHHQSTKSRTYP